MTTLERRLGITSTVSELRTWIAAERNRGRTIGFVPTMGALHDGHLSLIHAALASCDVAVASIFVNPMQFGPSEDLSRYPRTPDTDIRLLTSAGCHYLFMPDVSEMYPEGFRTRIEMSDLLLVLCGRTRPTHFQGVLTIVLKLLNQVRPDAAFFGRKDYQQALVIRRMVKDLDVPVRIETCPIIREADGLALSSRNRYLTPEERADAPGLRRAILAADRAFRDGTRDVARLVAAGLQALAAHPRFRPDYFEIRDPETLAERTEARAGDLVAAAAFIGRARLIDNGLLGQE